jgi:tRNA A-37 threonylcarbamoyl transferase component Bud32
VLLAIGLCYLAYFGALLVCDFRRGEELGLKLDCPGGEVHVRHVMPGSPAARAGLQTGDRITRLGAVELRTCLDRFAFHPRVSLDEPIPITWDRAGVHMRSTMTVSMGQHAFWGTRAGVTLAFMRSMQAAMLALALVIAWKQPRDIGALAGAWLLASLGLFSIVLPTRHSAVWRDLPAPLEMALWPPYLSSVGAGAILATFFTVFPRRAPHWRLILGIVWGLTLPFVAVSAYDRVQVMYSPDRAPLPSMMTWFGLPANLVSVLVGAVVMIRNYRRLPSETERRRVRVVFASSCVGCVSGGVAATYWATSGVADMTAGMFASRTLTLGILPAAILVPFSFAYAITRHRLFDIRVILRRGLQHALARRFLLSLIPAVTLLFLADIYAHPDRSLSRLRGGYLWGYVVLIGAGVWIYRRRAAWLDALDRRYFKERYNAQKLLRELAEDLQKGTHLEDILPAAARRIEAALHPQYVAVLLRSPDGRFYESMQPAGPAQPPVRFSAGDRVVRLLAVLCRPLVVGPEAPRTVFDQLPEDERTALAALQTELLIPVQGPGDTVEAVLALGMKRSEEPYSSEDLDLLTAAALNLRRLLPLSATTEECGTCGASYATGTGRCTADGAVLERSDTPPVLADRYAIERRLGRGGMGTVYAARDVQLNRRVAVKLLRERLESTTAVEQCRREARAAASLAHPNVVTIHDVGLTSDGRPFLVMELLRGQTLRDALSAGPLPTERTLSTLEGIAAALEAAHAQGLVHRDLKPENVFVVEGSQGDEGTRVKLLDFGISTLVDGQTGARSGALGTPEYAAPEQIRGECPQRSWDVWALAVIAFELMIGMRPVACVSIALGSGVSGGGATWNDVALHRLAPALAPVFSRALSLDPVQRHASPSALVADLSQVLR